MGDEQLVDQPGVDQLAVQSRAALAEQRADAALGAQVLEQRATRSTLARLAQDLEPAFCVSGGSAVDVVAIRTSPWPSVNSGASQGRSSRPETITISGSWRQPLALAPLALRGVADHWP